MVELSVGTAAVTEAIPRKLHHKNEMKEPANRRVVCNGGVSCERREERFDEHRERGRCHYLGTVRPGGGFTAEVPRTSHMVSDWRERTGRDDREREAGERGACTHQPHGVVEVY